MLEIIIAILLILWLLGVIGPISIGGNFVHVLLVVALVLIIIRLV
jgi:hypothetical protein